MELTLLFTLGNELYGLEISAIQEILESPQLHYVPQAEGVLAGAVNFHGQILAVIDLPGMLGFSDREHDHRWIVLTPEHRALTLMVSEIKRIVPLDLSSLQPPPANAGYVAIRGVANLDDRMINLLDTGKILNQLENIYAE